MSALTPTNLPMACPNEDCEEHGAAQSVWHTVDTRRRGWAFVIPDPQPTCDICGHELTHV